VRADAEGKLWVRIMSPTPAAGPEYDVIDKTGKLIDRVVLPAGTTIAGFGAAGTVYLGVRDASGVHIVRARDKLLDGRSDARRRRSAVQLFG
jgi:hypothetical protein